MAYKSKITTYVERRNTKVIFSTVKNAKGGKFFLIMTLKEK